VTASLEYTLEPDPVELNMGFGALYDEPVMTDVRDIAPDVYAGNLR
jgi:hypothetical protein